MYVGTQQFQTANDQPFQKHRIRGFIDDIPFSGANIIAGSLTMSNSCSNAPDSKLTAVNVGKLSLTISNNLSVMPMTWKNRTISLFFGLCIDEINNTYEEFQVGTWSVSEATINADGVSIVAYDSMTLFDKFLPDSYLVGGVPYDVAVAICRACGATFGMTSAQMAALPNGGSNFGLMTPNDCKTYRDVLFYLGQAVGSFATINAAGELIFRTYYNNTVPVKTITADKRVAGATFSDFATNYIAAVFENADGTTQKIGAISDQGATYYIGYNPFLQFGTDAAKTEQRTNIYNSIRSMQFTPFRIELISAPIFDLGDVVRFTGGILGEETEKIGIIQSITYQFNKGLILEGFGSDPALKDIETANESANSAARRASENSEIVYKNYENISAFTVYDDPVKVVEIDFSTNKETNVEVWHEIQLQTTRDTGADSMTVQAVFYLDNVEIVRKPIETFDDDAFHLLDLHNFLHIDETGSHIWEVFLIADGGFVNIRTGDAIACLKGQGISKADGWTGVIILDDEVERPFMVMDPGEFTDSISISFYDNQTISVSDTAERPFMVMNPGGFTDDIDVTLYHFRFNLTTENGDNLVDETGGSNIVTE